jgi:hypothetical protein
MVDVIETAPPAMDASGNSTIVWVPGTSKPVTATAVKAGKRITYSFTSTGWAPTFEQAIDVDARYTLKQQLQSFGLKTNGLTLTYVDSTDASSAAVLLKEGLTGFFVERRGVSNPADFAAGDKVRVYPVTLGPQNPVIAETGKETITQPTILTGVVGDPIVLT